MQHAASTPLPVNDLLRGNRNSGQVLHCPLEVLQRHVRRKRHRLLLPHWGKTPTMVRDDKPSELLSKSSYRLE